MKIAAFFDIDGTLVKCQTQQILAKMMTEERLLPFSHIIRIFLWFLIYKLGFVKTSIDIRKIVYKAFTFRSKRDIDAIFSRVYSEIINSKVTWNMKKVIDDHRSHGHLIFGISGSISNLCQPICREFKIEECFSTNLSVANGRYTGLWEGHIFEGEKKVELMNRLADEHRFNLRQSFAYADSYSDLPMLRAVGSPIVVYPDNRLREYAILHKWEILEGSF